MDFFNYKNGELCAEDVSLVQVAKTVGTPFYCYSSSTLEMHYDVFMAAFEAQGRNQKPENDVLVCYSIKANSNQAMLRTLAEKGAGMDVVSEGELRRAIAAGVPGNRIVFSGVGKTDSELRLGLETGIRQFNVESEPELERLSAIAVEMDVTAPVAVRINPNVDAKTHRKIATGKSENKFGIPISRAREVYRWAAQLPNISMDGIDVHIGSQLIDLEPFHDAFTLIAQLTRDLRSDGHTISQLDLGGGLGILYEANSNASPPSPAEYARMTVAALGDLEVDLFFEPGRSMAGNAGVLVSQVIFVKEGEDRRFVIVDAAMNDLMRPTLYDAYHDIVPVTEPGVDAVVMPVDIVGPVCETGDSFASQRNLPKVVRGDLIAIRSAGAYGAVQSSTYNSRLLIPEVMVKGDEFAIVRQRPSYDDLIALDNFAPWQRSEE